MKRGGSGTTLVPERKEEPIRKIQSATGMDHAPSNRTSGEGFKVPKKKKDLRGSKGSRRKLKKSKSEQASPPEDSNSKWVSFTALDSAGMALGLTNDSPEINNRQFGACFFGRECVDWLMELKDDEIFCASRQEAVSLAGQLLENKYFIQLIDASCLTFNEDNVYCVPRKPKRGSLHYTPITLSVRRKRANSDLTSGPVLEYKVEANTNSTSNGSATTSQRSLILPPTSESEATASNAEAWKKTGELVESYVKEEIEYSRNLKKQVHTLKDKVRELKRERKEWLLKSKSFLHLIDESGDQFPTTLSNRKPSDDLLNRGNNNSNPNQGSGIKNEAPADNNKEPLSEEAKKEKKRKKKERKEKARKEAQEEKVKREAEELEKKKKKEEEEEQMRKEQVAKEEKEKQEKEAKEKKDKEEEQQRAKEKEEKEKKEKEEKEKKEKEEETEKERKTKRGSVVKKGSGIKEEEGGGGGGGSSTIKREKSGEHVSDSGGKGSDLKRSKGNKKGSKKEPKKQDKEGEGSKVVVVTPVAEVVEEEWDLDPSSSKEPTLPNSDSSADLLHLLDEEENHEGNEGEGNEGKEGEEGGRKKSSSKKKNAKKKVTLPKKANSHIIVLGSSDNPSTTTTTPITPTTTTRSRKSEESERSENKNKEDNNDTEVKPKERKKKSKGPREQVMEVASSSGSRSPFKRANSFTSSFENLEGIMRGEGSPRMKERGLTWNKRKLDSLLTDANDSLPPLTARGVPTYSRFEGTPTPEMRAKDVYTQFLDSEKVYVRNLKKCIKHFVDPMREVKEEPLIAIDEDLDSCFSRLDRLRVLHEEIYSKARQSESFAFLLAFIPHLKKHYVEYITNHPRVVHKILAARTVNPKFKSFLANCWGKAEMDIESYLILPVQRLPRYEMLVGDYIKHRSLCKGSKVDIKQLTELAAHLKHIVQEANERRRRLENLDYLAELQERVTSSIGHLDLLHADRFLVREGDCFFWGLDQKFITAHYFLFNDIMLIAVKDSASGRKKLQKDKYKLKHLLQLNNVQVKQYAGPQETKPYAEDVFGITHSRSLGFKEELFHIKTESKEERLQLINDLRRLTKK